MPIGFEYYFRMTTAKVRRCRGCKRVVDVDSRVALDWPRPCLASRGSRWEYCRCRGEADRSTWRTFHAGSGSRPTWRNKAWCAGVLYGNLATCPWHSDLSWSGRTQAELCARKFRNSGHNRATWFPRSFVDTSCENSMAFTPHHSPREGY